MKNITVDSLNEKRRMQDLDIIVKEEIGLIDTKIQHTHDNGLSSCSYALPTSFLIEEMHQHDAQIYVYTELIKSYTTRGFAIKISLNDKPQLICSWINQLSITDMKSRKQLIKKYLI